MSTVSRPFCKIAFWLYLANVTKKFLCTIKIAGASYRQGPLPKNDRFSIVAYIWPGAYRGLMGPVARNKFGAPIFEFKVFWE